MDIFKLVQRRKICQDASTILSDSPMFVAESLIEMAREFCGGTENEDKEYGLDIPYSVSIDIF